MYTAILLAAAVQATSGDGLTLQEIIADLPTDPASVVTILMLVASLALVVWTGGRGAGPKGRGQQ